MKRIKLLSLVLIATLILSSLNIFAFASEEDPTDPNNPQIMMFYTGTAVIGGKTTNGSLNAFIPTLPCPTFPVS